jgi:hypothetical protein
VCVRLCITPIFARQRFGKNPLVVARQGLGKNPIVSRQPVGGNVTAVKNTHATTEELLDASFSVWLVSYQGKKFLFITFAGNLPPGFSLKYDTHNARTNVCLSSFDRFIGTISWFPVSLQFLESISYSIHYDELDVK